MQNNFELAQQAASEMVEYDGEEDNYGDDYGFALPTEDVGEFIKEKFEAFQQLLINSGKLRNWRKRICYYNGNYANEYGNPIEGLFYRGQNAEYTEIYINEFKSLLKTSIGQLTSNPVSFNYHSTNTDYLSEQQSALWQTVADYYQKQKNLDALENRAIEYAYLMDAGYILVEWDTGEGHDFETKLDDVYRGDIKASVPLTIDVAFDPSKEDPADHDWYVVQCRIPRIKYLVRYPEFKDDINASKYTHDGEFHDFRTMGSDWNNYAGIQDDIVVYKFFHKINEVMPQGRQCIVLGNGVCVSDLPLTYKDLPIRRFVINEEVGNTWGHSPAVDLIGPQEALNLLHSTELTCYSNFGIQLIAIAMGTNFDTASIQGGLAVIEYPGTPGSEPKGINLAAPPPGLAALTGRITQQMQQVLGVSPVSRGDASDNLHSGSSLALAASMTAQQMGSTLMVANRFRASVMTLLIRILRDFVNPERVISIAGVNSGAAATLAQKDLADFDRVEAEIGNPITGTFAGKVQLASELLQNKAVDAQGYIQVLSSGNLGTMLEGPRNEQALVEMDCERIRQGLWTHIIPTDNHQAFIGGYKKILDDPQYRYAETPEALQVFQTTLDLLQQRQQMMAPPPSAPVPLAGLCTA